MTESSRMRVVAAVVVVLLLGSAPVRAENDYPSKPIRMIVPWPAGGVTDVQTRRVTMRMEKILGQPIVVENRVGAMGSIGSAHVARAAPDGYTLLRGDVMTHAIDPALIPDLPYDSVRDFAPISAQARGTMLLLVHPSLPVNSIRDLIALAKSKPGELKFAIGGGIGTPAHLATLNFKQLSGAEILEVPYKGEAPALTDLVAGHVQVMFAFTATPGGFVKAGKLRALAVTDDKRIGLLPDVPSVVEAGFPELQMSGWGGFFAPAGTPRPIVTKLNATIVKVLADPELKRILDELGSVPMPMSPEEFAAFIASERKRWEVVVRKAGVRLE